MSNTQTLVYVVVCIKRSCCLYLRFHHIGYGKKEKGKEEFFTED